MVICPKMCEKGNCRTNVAFDHSYSDYSLCKARHGLLAWLQTAPHAGVAASDHFDEGGSFSDSTEGSPRYKYGTSTRWEVVTPQSM